LAEWINDLFDDSPLEDCLWDEFKRLEFDAERQWGVWLKNHYYRLDFALFCNQGQIDIEADGDSWHSEKNRIPIDNQRDNDLTSRGWHILRFNGQQIREELGSYCLGKIAETVNTLGGLSEANIVPRIFYPAADGTILQLTLFDGDDAEYDTG